MKIKNKILVTIILILVLILIIIGIIIFSRKIDLSDNNIINNNMIELADNMILPEIGELSEEETEQVNEIKTDLGFTGNTDLYEVQENYGVKVAVVKPSIKYKVAFSGMIKKQIPEMNELDNIIKENHPKYAGIYVEENSKEKFLELIHNNTKSTYKFNDQGYLRIDNKNSQNENDKILEQCINGNKLYILSISSNCYIVDDVTGEILSYNFEKLDKYKTYEYFNDNDKFIIFLTENNNNLLSTDEITNSFYSLISQ